MSDSANSLTPREILDQFMVPQMSARKTNTREVGEVTIVTLWPDPFSVPCCHCEGYDAPRFVRSYRNKRGEIVNHAVCRCECHTIYFEMEARGVDLDHYDERVARKVARLGRH